MFDEGVIEKGIGDLPAPRLQPDLEPLLDFRMVGIPDQVAMFVGVALQVLEFEGRRHFASLPQLLRECISGHRLDLLVEAENRFVCVSISGPLAVPEDVVGQFPAAVGQAFIAMTASTFWVAEGAGRIVIALVGRMLPVLVVRFM